MANTYWLFIQKLGCHVWPMEQRNFFCINSVALNPPSHSVVLHKPHNFSDIEGNATGKMPALSAVNTVSKQRQLGRKLNWKYKEN